MHVFSRPAFAAPAVAAAPVPRFMPGTPVETPDGPRAVETLRVGDRVTTRGEARPIASVGHRAVAREDWTYRRTIWPVRVPVGSLGNPVPLRLAAEQLVLLAGPAFAGATGEAEAWVPLGMLIGLRGLATERPLGALRQHGLAFEDDDAEGGADAVRVAGVWCDLGRGGAEPDRDRMRAAFQAMNAAGEPPLA